jgi:tetratricopeptide (TPR) repeat protein
MLARHSQERTDMNPCPDENVLHKFVIDGGLTESEAAAVEEHVGSCEQCQKVLDLLTGEPFFPPPLGRAIGSDQSQRMASDQFSLAGYQIGGEISRHESVVVYRARDLTRNRDVAIKVLTGSSNDYPRFAGEMQALRSLGHPHIVTAHQVCLSVEGPSYIIMEFAAGGSLDKRIVDGEPWPPGAAAELLRWLADAVQFAHSRNFIHRDLKPGNILLCEAEHGQGEALTSGPAQGLVPKVADFGLAKLVWDSTSLTKTGTILGTVSYMSPEQAEGKELSHETDVYALGAILYHLLTGRAPFVAPLPITTIIQVVQQEPVSPARLHPKLPRDLETICLKCLQKAPRRRYPSAAALSEDLKRFLDGKPIRARPVSHSERAWKWANRNRSLVSACLVLLAAMAVGGALAAWWQTTLRAETETQRDRVMEIAQVTLDALNLLADTFAGENPAVPEEEVPLGVRQVLAHQIMPFVNRVLQLGADAGGAQAVEAKARLGQAKLGRLLGKNFAELADDCRRAEALYAALSVKDPVNPLYRHGRAAALNSAGVLLGLQGNLPECLKALRSARREWEELATAFPDCIDYRFHLGLCLNNLGNGLKTDTDGKAAAREAYGAAVNEFGWLCDKLAGKFLYRDWLSRALGNRGLLLVELKEFASAAVDLSKAEVVAMALVADYPTSRRAKECLYAALVNLGELHTARKEYDAAERMFARALALYEPLVRDYPKEVEYRWGRALALLSLGVIQRKDARLKEAQATLVEASRLYETLASAHPDLDQVAKERQMAQLTLAEVERDLTNSSGVNHKTP